MIFQQIQNSPVPALGFGTWQLTGQPCQQAVAEAIQIGYRHIDTAALYNNEEYVGKGIKQSGIKRSDLFVTSKVWYTHLHRDQVHASAEESLQKLETDYLDLLLVHWPNPEVPLRETLEAMQELQQSGKIKHIGVSNFTPGLMQEAIKVASIFCNQVEYHPYLSQKPLLDFCRQHNILLTAYAPVAHGKVNSDPVLQQIGNKYGKSPVQITLRWLIQQPLVSAIPKAGSTAHRKSNFDIMDFELTSQEMEAIFRLAHDERLVNPHWAPDWEK